MKRQLLIDYRGERSQSEMAKQYGVSQQIWSKWENGTQKPKTVTMKRLEDAIGRPMEEIFFDVFYNIKGFYPSSKKKISMAADINPLLSKGEEV